MENKLDELKAKAQELLEVCNDGAKKKEALDSIKEGMTAFLNDIKKLNKDDKVSLDSLADQVRNKIVSFMTEELNELQEDAKNKIAGSMDEKTLQDTKVFFLGKKGKLTAILRGMKDVSAEQRPVIGALANQVRENVEAAIADKMEELKAKRLQLKIERETVDITLPARHQKVGHIHPLDKALREIMKSFVRMGYSVEEGPEIEQDYYNFECLNLPKDHPARDMQDSFYITPDILLRTHTSPVQARTLRKHEPNSPIRMIAPGKVFRWDNDATHSPVFHQVEGLVVDKGISFADLKGTLEIFLKDLFGSDTKIRFRASYFPFTEPSAEVDISFAARTGEEDGDPDWLEILGCGMVHPMVLKLNGYDPEKVSGFAFGMGIERIAMLLYGIDDLRNFYENDVRFLKQF
jgi:phenylalanyl-tRNA synthetase alpha chain